MRFLPAIWQERFQDGNGIWEPVFERANVYSNWFVCHTNLNTYVGLGKWVCTGRNFLPDDIYFSTCETDELVNGLTKISLSERYSVSWKDHTYPFGLLKFMDAAQLYNTFELTLSVEEQLNPALLAGFKINSGVRGLFDVKAVLFHFEHLMEERFPTEWRSIRLFLLTQD